MKFVLLQIEIQEDQNTKIKTLETKISEDAKKYALKSAVISKDTVQEMIDAAIEGVKEGSKEASEAVETRLKDLEDAAATSSSKESKVKKDAKSTSIDDLTDGVKGTLKEVALQNQKDMEADAAAQRQKMLDDPKYI